MIVCNKCNRNFKNDGAFGRHAKDCNCKPGDADKVFELYQSGKSLREIHALGFDRRLIKTTLKGKTRFISEALKVKFTLNETRKHTEQSKVKLSIIRKEWLKKNRDKHNWRYKGETYPEKIFREWLSTLKIEFETEHTPIDFDKNYSMDFVILKDKICIEINGNQHYNKDGTFTDYHKTRETYISSKGWKVFNVKANDVVKRFDQVKQFFKGILYE